jgi:hypothetical protein
MMRDENANTFVRSRNKTANETVLLGLPFPQFVFQWFSNITFLEKYPVERVARSMHMFGGSRRRWTVVKG